MFVGFPTLKHATCSCPREKHGSQCCHVVRETFPRKDETVRRSKKVHKHRGFRHRHTRDCQGWQHCVVIPLAKHLAERRERLRRLKKCVVRRQGTEEGRTKVR